MPQIYLFRHGVAVDRVSANAPDAERPLSEEGVSLTKEAAQGLRALNVAATGVASSPYKRAIQTASILIDALDIPKKHLWQTEALIPDADPREILAELAEREAKDTVCVGHAPNLDRILSLLVGAKAGEITSLKKAGVAAIELSAWKAGAGKILWLLPPKVLRNLSK